MYFNGLSVLLKPPSPTSIEHAHHKRQSRYIDILQHSLFIIPDTYYNLYLFVYFRFNLTEHETNTLTNLKSSITTELVSSDELKDYPGIFKRAKGPNPLSCKPKKKKNNEDNVPKVENKTKRKRNRIKIPKHVKEELKKMKQQTESS